MNAALRRAVVGLGSNLDSPAQRVREAAALIGRVPGVSTVGLSRLFATPPWGMLDQPGFVNAVMLLDTGLSADALLNCLMAIEQSMGRVRGERWGPRRIDLDLLHVDGEQVDSGRLQLPHPRLSERAFVLVPWADIAADADVPGLGRIAELLQKVDCSGIQPLP